MSLKKWVIDSCPCIILFDDATFTFVSFEARCDEHKLLDGQRLYDGIVLHNQSFNSQYSVPPTPTREEVDAEATRVTALKTTERERIKANGPTETR